MKNIYSCTDGFGLSRFSSFQTGLPVSQPTWIKNYGGQGSGSSPFVSTGDDLYYGIWNQDGSRDILIVDFELGSEKSRFKVPPSDVFLNMFAGNTYLIVNNFFYASSRLESPVDFNELIVDGKKFHPDIPFGVGENIVARVIDPLVNPNEYFIFDINTQEFRNYLLPYIGGTLFQDSDLIFGLRNINEGVCDVGCCDSEGEVVWEVPSLGLGVMMASDNLLHITGDMATVINRGDGSLVFQSNAHKGIFDLEALSTSNKCFCDDTFTIISNGNLYFFSFTRDEMLNCIENISAAEIYAAGDLVFVKQEKWNVVAYDRYSGKELWRCSEPYTWQSLIATNNKLIAHCSTGEIISFDCGEPYISPHRPD